MYSWTLHRTVLYTYYMPSSMHVQYPVNVYSHTEQDNALLSSALTPPCLLNFWAAKRFAENFSTAVDAQLVIKPKCPALRGLVSRTANLFFRSARTASTTPTLPTASSSSRRGTAATSTTPSSAAGPARWPGSWPTSQSRRMDVSWGEGCGDQSWAFKRLFRSAFRPVDQHENQLPGLHGSWFSCRHRSECRLK